jgi:hypothetical protein
MSESEVSDAGCGSSGGGPVEQIAFADVPPASCSLISPFDPTLLAAGCCRLILFFTFLLHDNRQPHAAALPSPTSS